MGSASDRQDHAAKVRNLQRVIEEQQRQLDAQQEQLEAQKKQLQNLRQQVQELAEGPAPTKAPATEKSAAAPSGSGFARRNDTQTDVRDKLEPLDEWQGSFKLDGSNTRFKIGGFVRLDVIHDSDAITKPGLFETAAIVTRDATKAEGADGQTNFSVSPSRLYVDDPIYGVNANPNGIYQGLPLGNIFARGETHYLTVPLSQFMRLRHNPFFSYIE